LPKLLAVYIILFKIIAVFLPISLYIVAKLNIISGKREPGNMIRRVLLVVALVIVVFSLVGCQTVQGLGEDITWLGEKGSELVEK
jgi:predicted small secreted protein